MKRIFILYSLVIIGRQGFSQVTITAGTHWVNAGNVTVTINDLDIMNNGDFVAGNSLIKFTGSADKIIGGNSNTTFYNIELAKTGNKKLILQANTNLDHQLTFTSGLLDLNQKNLTLAAMAFLNNENETSRIIGPNGGEAIITLPMNAPNSVNPGNLGSIITSSADLGTVTIRRGHKLQTGTGLSASIFRYYDITPANNTTLNAVLRFNYFDAELNSQAENAMIMFRSIDNGANWTNQPVNNRDVASNYVEKTGISSFSRWTLSSSIGAALPVLGLQFNAKRISNTKVQLDWKTLQEINNVGFYVERKKETDNDFAVVGFLNSAAMGGNSNLPLAYSKIDSNSFPGKTLYRLKQQDIDGHVTYSVTRVVNGEVSNAITLKAWPVPAVSDFFVMIQGVDKDILQVLDVTGRLVQQVPVTENTQQKVNKLAPGTYFLRLANNKDIQQKIITQ